MTSKGLNRFCMLYQLYKNKLKEFFGILNKQNNRRGLSNRHFQQV